MMMHHKNSLAFGLCTAEEGAHLWLIPVSISTESSQGEVHTTFVVDKPTTTIKVDNVGPEEWVKVCVTFKQFTQLTGVCQIFISNSYIDFSRVLCMCSLVVVHNGSVHGKDSLQYL